MFDKKREVCFGEDAIVVRGVGECSLVDTLECGQAFRYEKLCERDGYVEYMTVVRGLLVRVGQRERGELIFYGIGDEDFERVVRPYFALDTDFEAIRQDVISRTDSDWLKRAAEEAKGITILRQEPWETLFSFIVSQYNNIPRIKKIIKAIAAEYGTNLAEKYALLSCPLPDGNCTPGCEKCKGCGICYSFPTPYDVMSYPEGLLPSKPGFRYKYLVDAAKAITEGRIDLQDISDKKSYDYTLAELKKILGVGDKVASCVALFGFSNLEAFPIDVWMKRAIDEYFGGKLDPTSLGPYAGVAQQYIFHYIRNLRSEND